MANVFNGQEFLKSKEVEIKLSNGFGTTVKEITDEQLDSLGELSNTESASAKDIRATVANLLGADVNDLNGVNLIELRGVMDFLTERLFG